MGEVKRVIKEKKEEYDGLIISINSQEYKVKDVPTVELNCVELGNKLAVVDRHETRHYRCLNTPQLGIGEYAYEGKDRRNLRFIRVRPDRNRAQSKEVYESLRASPTITSLPDPFSEEMKVVSSRFIDPDEFSPGKVIANPQAVVRVLQHSREPVSKTRIVYAWLTMFSYEPSTVECKAVEDMLKDRGNSEHYRTVPVPDEMFSEHTVLVKAETISELRTVSGSGPMEAERYIDLRRKAGHSCYLFPEWYFRNRIMSEASIEGDNVRFRYKYVLQREEFDRVNSLVSSYTAIRVDQDPLFSREMLEWVSVSKMAQHLRNVAMPEWTLRECIRIVEQHPIFEYSCVRGQYRITPCRAIHCALIKRFLLKDLLLDFGIKARALDKEDEIAHVFNKFSMDIEISSDEI